LVVCARSSSEADRVVDAWKAATERAAELRQQVIEQQLQEEEQRRLRLERECEEHREARLAEAHARHRSEEEQRQLEERQQPQEQQQCKDAPEQAIQAASRRKATLDTFFKQHGFHGVNEPRRSGCGVWAVTTTYPLHVAAELADASTTGLLLKEGADPMLLNSSGRTAAQVAKRRAKGNSHKEVLDLLHGQATGRSKSGGA